MKKLTALLVFLLFLLFTKLSANDITIQLAAFSQPVDTYSYFEGVSNVKMIRNGQNLYIYYIDGIQNKSLANKKLAELNRMGYKALEIDLNEIYACQNACQKNNTNKDRYNLTEGYTPKELQDYEKVRIVMMNDLSSTIVLKGNSQKMQCYLNMRGISNCRMIVKDEPTTQSPLKVWVYNSANEILDVESTFRTIIG